MEELVQQVIIKVGGLNNIKSCTNCLTRLRLELSDDKLADHVQVKSIMGVFEIIEAEEQFQLLLGPGRAKKAATLLKKLIR